MTRFESYRPDITEFFCLYCRKLKPRYEMVSARRCHQCKREYKVSHTRAYRLKAKTTQKPKRPGHPKTALSHELMAAVCEDYIGLDMPMKDVAKRHGIHFATVSKIIGRYFAFGLPPITVEIRFDE